MRILITGSTGQLGQQLRNSAPKTVLGEQPSLVCLDRHSLDMSDLDACRKAIREIEPDWLINAAAYTQVDKAEREPQLAYLVNVDAPEVMSREMAHINGKMLQLSTDFVFDGNKSRPYQPEDQVNPLSVYGASKAAGEEAVLSNLVTAHTKNGYVLRTSWLYGSTGKNFFRTMLRLHSQQQEIRVISDHIGCPTSTRSLAPCCWKIVENASREDNGGLPSRLHWSDAGVSSWYDFTVAIGELGISLGLLDKSATVVPISMDEYPMDAPRPSFSLLNTSLTRKYLNMKVSHWRDELQRVAKEMVDHNSQHQL